MKGIDEEKATGLDNIPCKLLKIADNVIVPSLMFIFLSITTYWDLPFWLKAG